MTTRRQFIKAAGAITGAVTLPSLVNANATNKTTSVNFSTASTDDELFAMVRKQLLIPSSRIYLNTGSLGPSPLVVLEAVEGAMRQLEMNPVSENWGPLGKQMEEVRTKVATFINATREEVLLTRNTTEGLGLITQTIGLKAGDEILTTTQEHEGALVGMEYMAKTKGVVVQKVSIPMPTTSTEEVINAVQKGITAKTKLVVLSHINTVTGLVMPFAEISKITKAKGIVLVGDGAQAPGLIRVDVAALGVDAYAASGHKWLLGPKETGFFYLNKKMQPTVQALFNYSGFDTYSASSGTRNVAIHIGLGAAIDLHQQIGVDKIHQRCLETRNYCLTELKKLNGLTINSPEKNEQACGIVSFNLTKAINKDVYNKLKEQDIIVKLLSGGNSIRISCHMFITKSDIDTFISALKPLLS